MTWLVSIFYAHFLLALRALCVYKQYMEKSMTAKEHRRDERVHVLLTKVERERVQAAADKAGLGISTFIRVKTLGTLDENG